MVEGIEGVHAEEELLAFRNVEGLGDGGIELLLPISVQGIRSGRAIGHRGGVDDEGGGVKPLVHGWIAQRSIANAVWMIGLSVVERSCIAVGHVEAGSATDMYEGRILPAAEHSIHHAIGIAQVPLAAADWKFRAQLRIEDVSNILLRGTVVLIDIGLIEIVAVSKIAA